MKIKWIFFKFEMFQVSLTKMFIGYIHPNTEEGFMGEYDLVDGFDKLWVKL